MQFVNQAVGVLPMRTPDCGGRSGCYGFRPGQLTLEFIEGRTRFRLAARQTLFCVQRHIFHAGFTLAPADRV